MNRLNPRLSHGSAVVALMLVAVIILGSLLMLHTAAVVTVGGTSRAFDIARQNSATAVRLERATREAAQTVFGVSVVSPARTLSEELHAILAMVPLGAVTVENVQVDSTPEKPRVFPTLVGVAAPLAAPSSDLSLFFSPELLEYLGSRVAESATFTVRYAFTRNAVASEQRYAIAVSCRLASVPVTRFGLTAYDLPGEIGLPAPALAWPHDILPTSIAPRGLVPARDPANMAQLTSGQKRAAHFRYAAVLAETFRTVFSTVYLQNAVDCAGETHAVQISAGSANPVLGGGTESGNSYTLDVAAFGRGTLGSREVQKDLAVIFAISAGKTLVLTDSGGTTAPMLLVVAGPADRAVAPLTLRFGTAITRPVVVVCYHTRIEAAPGLAVNGALLLDPDCILPASVAPLALGHLSYWAGGDVAVDAVHLSPMPATAEDLAPRAVYVATAKTFL